MCDEPEPGDLPEKYEAISAYEDGCADKANVMIHYSYAILCTSFSLKEVLFHFKIMYTFQIK